MLPTVCWLRIDPSANRLRFGLATVTAAVVGRRKATARAYGSGCIRQAEQRTASIQRGQRNEYEVAGGAGFPYLAASLVR